MRIDRNRRGTLTRLRRVAGASQSALHPLQCPGLRWSSRPRLSGGGICPSGLATLVAYPPEMSRPPDPRLNRGLQVGYRVGRRVPQAGTSGSGCQGWRRPISKPDTRGGIPGKAPRRHGFGALSGFHSSWVAAGLCAGRGGPRRSWRVLALSRKAIQEVVNPAANEDADIWRQVSAVQND
jgi:hypothetical protein